MFGRDRGDRGALVVLAIIVVGAIIVAWLGDPADQIIKNYGQPNSGGNDPSGKAVEAVYWGIFTTRDTLAQWIAAAAALLSVGVSIWAVKLVRRSLHEAQTATKAAFDANGIASDTAKRELRAYVGVPEVKFGPTSSGVLAIVTTAKNFGQTPASNVVVKQYARFDTRFAESSGSPQYTTEKPACLFQGQEIYAVVAIPQIAGIEQAILNGDYIVSLIGEVNYNDAFNTPRTTHFKFIFDIVDRDKGIGSFKVAANGNSYT